MHCLAYIALFALPGLINSLAVLDCKSGGQGAICQSPEPIKTLELIEHRSNVVTQPCLQGTTFDILSSTNMWANSDCWGTFLINRPANTTLHLVEATRSHAPTHDDQITFQSDIVAMTMVRRWWGSCDQFNFTGNTLTTTACHALWAVAVKDTDGGKPDTLSEQVITCSNTVPNAKTECFTGGQVLDYFMKRRLGGTCRENLEFGATLDSIWVSGDCNAEFGVRARTNKDKNSVPRRTLHCSSTYSIYTRCRANTQITDVQVNSESYGNCRPGIDFGFYGDTLWVVNECRAEFIINSGTHHTCSSNNNAQTICGRGTTVSRVDLVRTISNPASEPCIEGKTFGHPAFKDGTGYWVSGNCKGDFWLNKPNGTQLEVLHCYPRTAATVNNCRFSGSAVSTSVLKSFSGVECKLFIRKPIRTTSNRLVAQRTCNAQVVGLVRHDFFRGLTPANNHEMTCESTGQYTECEAGVKILNVRHLRTLHGIDVACTKGQSYGWSGTKLWVKNNCRGVFRINPDRVIQCESETDKIRVHLSRRSLFYDLANQNTEVTCPTGLPVGSVELVQGLSDYRTNPCIQDLTYGYRNGSIWVKDGCRGTFAINRPKDAVAHSLVCSSTEADLDWVRCPVRGAIQTARLLKQLNNDRCIEGQTFQVGDGAIMVKEACSGLFYVEVRDQEGGVPSSFTLPLRCSHAKAAGSQFKRCGAKDTVLLHNKVYKTNWGTCREGVEAVMTPRELDMFGDCDALLGMTARKVGSGVAIPNRVVQCSSDPAISTRGECRANTRINDFALQKVIAGSCVRDKTFGVVGDTVWVNGGCQADFLINSGILVQCGTTNDLHKVVCAASEIVKRVEVVEQISATPCRPGVTFGWPDRDGAGYWVKDGCVATFKVNRAPSTIATTMFCQSNNPKNLEECFPGKDVESVHFLRYLGGSHPCLPGNTYGVLGGKSIYVSQYCKAFFYVVMKRSEGKAPTIIHEKVECQTAARAPLTRCTPPNTAGEVLKSEVLKHKPGSSACVENVRYKTATDGVEASDGCSASFIAKIGVDHRNQSLLAFNRELVCTSLDREVRCHANTPILNAHVITSFGTRCREGIEMGWTGDELWVKGGCRARFLINSDALVACGSDEGGGKECAVGKTLRAVEVAQQVSDVNKYPCVKDVTFGVKNNSIWTKAGCKANFVVNKEAASTGQFITCANNRNQSPSTICPFTGSFSRGHLVTQQSSWDCRADETFKFTSSNIQVLRGCSGVFYVETN